MKNLMLLLIMIILSGCTEKKTSVVTTAPTIVPKKEIPEFLVVPGERVGKIAILQNTDSLQINLGTPDLADSAMGKAWLTWYGAATDTLDSRDEINVYTNYRDNEMREKVVRQIRVTSPDYKTADSIGTGSTIYQIRIAYPDTKLQGSYVNPDSGAPVQVYDDSRAGIAFEIEDSACVSIIVHEPSKNVTDDYITFHPDMIRE